jgi:uncharacterized protein
MIKRDIDHKLMELAQKFPVITITGPRQSGKTTLVKNQFSHKSYVSLEEPDVRQFALTDPRAFLAQFPNGAILDEVQRCPELFSYIQSIVDETGKNGLFILTGSQHFLLLNSITQSLAGRTAILKLLPLSLNELWTHNLKDSLQNHIFNGFYPRIFNENIPAQDLYPNYIETYIERDVRTLKNVSNLNLFYKFIKLLAGRVGQLVNYTSLGNDCGLSHSTVKEWISLLEASFIVYTLQPFHRNFNKRLIKSPKIYFYDTGLLCSLLGLSKPEDYTLHFLKGGIFENFILNDVKKYYFNRGLKKDLYFWRDKSGREIDLIIEDGVKNKLFEIKSAETFNVDFIKNLAYFNKISDSENQLYLINSGSVNQQRSEFKIVSWQDVSTCL